MILVEQTAVPIEALPLTEFRDYLRLGTGFADDTLQDSVLETCLRAALSAIEARTGKVLIARTFRWTLTGWRYADRQALPVAPVSEIGRVSIFDRAEVETVVSPESYALERDTHRPAILSLGSRLPAIPAGGTAEVEFVAGYSDTWMSVPPALQKAGLMLAAHYYEHRHAIAFEADGIPAIVNDLLLPFLNIRLFGAGR